MKAIDYNPPMSSEEKLICRKINRISKRKGSLVKICKSKSLGMFQNVGRFYILDISRNLILYYNVGPEDWLKGIG